MNPPQIISAQKDLLLKCGKDTDYSRLKSNTLSLNKQYVDFVSRGGFATSFEKRQVKNNMSKLFRVLEKADFEKNRNKFEFVGPPQPPVTDLFSSPVIQVEEATISNKISGKRGKKLSVGTEYAKIHVYIEDLIDSSVWGRRNSECLPHSVHIQNVKNCEIMLRCDGPIILHGVENSVLILDCHQLRIHDMKRCRVLANVTNSRVIIEKSENLKFSGVFGNEISAPLFAIDDFDWPTSEVENPHYEMTGLVGDTEKMLMRDWMKEKEDDIF